MLEEGMRRSGRSPRDRWHEWISRAMRIVVVSSAVSAAGREARAWRSLPAVLVSMVPLALVAAGARRADRS